MITCKLSDGIASVPSTGKVYIDPRREERRRELFDKANQWLEAQKKGHNAASEELNAPDSI